jgi:2-C-methyl-D-erythritol 4-phosphate cytidylyltransferase/2-C-methyl-D-erythritol 2,4-cyclodiphosphate synthase
VTVAAVIVAAGRGTRAATGCGPKQFVRLAGRSVLARAVDAFAGHGGIWPIQVVVHPDDEVLWRAALAGHAPRLPPPCHGGATRQASVRAGLEALAPLAPDAVLIHDAARPFVDAATIARVVAALVEAPAAIAAVPLADALKRAAPDGTVAATLPREGLFAAQTPQGFRYAAILAAHRAAAAAGRTDFTDDAALAEWAGLAVRLVPGSAGNLKLTTTEDIAMAEARFATALEYRTGTGFDVHRLIAGDRVWLCGVEISHSHGLEGHSDADVGLHALTDALLGAIADGDIGQHFPPNEPRWRGAASRIFLAEAAARVRARGGRIVNVDVTLLCEAPRIGPHRARMQAAIADALAIEPARVGVKATTTEGLGFTGRREGIAAMASATVALPAG